MQYLFWKNSRSGEPMLPPELLTWTPRYIEIEAISPLRSSMLKFVNLMSGYSSVNIHSLAQGELEWEVAHICRPARMDDPRGKKRGLD